MSVQVCVSLSVGSRNWVGKRADLEFPQINNRLKRAERKDGGGNANEKVSEKVLTDTRTELLGDVQAVRKSGLQGATLQTDNAETPGGGGM